VGRTVSESLRAAVAAGLIIPFDGPDFEDEFKNIAKDEPVTLSTMDKHVLGVGGRFYFDYIVNEKFFINLYNQTILYPVKQDLNRHKPTLTGAKGLIPMGVYLATYEKVYGMTGNQATADAQASGAADLAASGLKDAKGEADFKYSLTFEIEPVFTTFIADGINLTAGLPINYKYAPAADISVSGITETLAASDVNLEKMLLGVLEEQDSHSLSLNPGLSVFFMKIPLPMEFKASYSIPVWGQNAKAQHQIVLQIRAYFKF